MPRGNLIGRSGTRYRLNTYERTGIAPSTPLTWDPPILHTSGVTTIQINDDPATRNITLSPNQDCILYMPDTIGDYTAIGNRDALIVINGGRHVQVIGGHIQTKPHLFSTVTVAVSANDTVVQVDSTAGYPVPGQIRLGGEGIKYTGVTPTSFTGCTRAALFYNSWIGSSNSTHPVGAIVDTAENVRSGMEFNNQTGIVHVEGVKIEGTPGFPWQTLNDGIRISRTGAATRTGAVQIQNCRIGPNGPWDMVGGTDGHADCIQIIGGPGELRLDRVALLSGEGGRGILNKGSDASSAMLSGSIKNTDFISTAVLNPNGGSLYNYDTSTAWTIANAWDASVAGTGGTVNLREAFTNTVLDSIGAQFCLPTTPGTDYISPGYASGNVVSL